MSFFIQLNESNTNLRRVPFSIYGSDGTTPDTGASNDTVMMSFNGGAQESAGSVSAISAAAGQYYVQLAASAVSANGMLRLWYDLGDFPLELANVQVVGFDPYGSIGISSKGSALQGGTTSTLTLASHETSTNDWFNGSVVYLQYPTGQVISNEISDYTGSGTVVQLKNTLPIAASSSVSYWIVPGVLNDLSLQTVRGLANYSNLSGSYSAMTVHASQASNCQVVSIGTTVLAIKGTGNQGYGV